MKFCGREEELEVLKQRWALTSDKDKPTPQIVVIKAEAGLGKTRLATRFFEWLANEHNPDGYWPSELGADGNNLRVNPDRDACNFGKSIPFLWWGVRAADVNQQNSVSGNAVSNYNGDLAPHLISLGFRQGLLESSIDVAKFAGECALNASGAGAWLQAGQGFLEVVKIIRNAQSARQAEAALAAGDEKLLSNSEAVIEDLSRLIRPNIVSRSIVPAVLLFDDAQFAEYDPGLTKLIRTLLQRIFKENWPVMVIVTHWRRELAEGAPSDQSFASYYRAALADEGSETSSAQNGEGPYIETDQATEIDLLPIPDLRRALLDKLTGLKERPDQQELLLAHVDGNPRFLEQLILLAQTRKRVFEERNPEKALTDKGLTYLLEQAVDVRKAIEERLQQSPAEVKEAVVAASVQGIRFAPSVVNEVANRIFGHQCAEGLSEAAEPYSFIRHGDTGPDHSVSEYAERLLYHVAKDYQEDIDIPEGATDDFEEVYVEVLREKLADKGYLVNTDRDEVKLLLSAAISKFQEEDFLDHHLVLMAAEKLSHLEQENYNTENAKRAALILYEVLISNEEIECLEGLYLENIITLLCLAQEMEAAQYIANRYVAYREKNIQSKPEHENILALCSALNCLGMVHFASCNWEASHAVCSKSVGLLRPYIGKIRRLNNLLLDPFCLLAQISLMRGDYLLGKEYLEKCLELSITNEGDAFSEGERLKLAKVYNLVGALELGAGNIAEGKSSYTKSLKLAGNMQSSPTSQLGKHILISTLGGLIKVARETGDILFEGEALKEVLRLRMEVDALEATGRSKRGILGTLASLEKIARLMGDVEAARKYNREVYLFKREWKAIIFGAGR